MNPIYNKYYQAKNYFGDPYPELIEFFKNLLKKGKLLDLGCGQGRNAIALAKMGYEVTGIDISKVGVDQMLQAAKAEKLKITGLVDDIYNFEKFSDFDFILLDSMFHFQKKDKEKETSLIQNIFRKIKNDGIIIFCIPATANICKTLREILNAHHNVEIYFEKSFVYEFKDNQSGHSSSTDYRMIAAKKQP